MSNEPKDKIMDLVKQIFMKYDADRSGFLDKVEVLKLVDDILLNQGRPKTNWAQFNRFFAEFDNNGDGLIS
jgi:Ca2+-binding EF-hand superfamily protein